VTKRDEFPLATSPPFPSLPPQAEFILVGVEPFVSFDMVVILGRTYQARGPGSFCVGKFPLFSGVIYSQAKFRFPSPSPPLLFLHLCMFLAYNVNSPFLFLDIFSSRGHMLSHACSVLQQFPPPQLPLCETEDMPSPRSPHLHYGSISS